MPMRMVCGPGEDCGVALAGALALQATIQTMAPFPNFTLRTCRHADARCVRPQRGLRPRAGADGALTTRTRMEDALPRLKLTFCMPEGMPTR